MENKLSQSDREKALEYACKLMIKERKGNYHTLLHLQEAGLSLKESKEIIREADQKKRNKKDVELLIGVGLFFLGLIVLVFWLKGSSRRGLKVASVLMITGISLIYKSSKQ